MEKILLMRK